jgi:hypothetical protein
MLLGDRIGLVGLVVALIGIAAFYLWPDKKWIGWLALCAAGVLLLIWLWLELHQKHERPHISAELVIDSVEPNGEAPFHFELVNIGDIGVTVSKVSFSTPSEAGVEPEMPMVRDLPPNKGRLRVSMPPVGFVLKPQNQNIDLNVEYKIPSEKMFSSSFRYFIQPRDIRPQTLIPEYLAEYEGVANNQEANAITKVLLGPQGTLFLVLDEKLNDGEPNVVRIHDTSKDFVFDPISRNVLWKVTTTRRIVNLSQNLPEKSNGRHLVVLIWDYSKGGTLRVDGIEKADMDNP